MKLTLNLLGLFLILMNSFLPPLCLLLKRFWRIGWTIILMLLTNKTAERLVGKDFYLFPVGNLTCKWNCRKSLSSAEAMKVSNLTGGGCQAVGTWHNGVILEFRGQMLDLMKGKATISLPGQLDTGLEIGISFWMKIPSKKPWKEKDERLVDGALVVLCEQ